MSYVNIWVTDIVEGAPKRLVAWGVGSNLAEGNDKIVNLHGLDCYVRCRETPAEIAALIAAEQRKRDRLMLAAMAMQGYLANPNISRWLPHEIAGPAAQSADALLAALEGAE